MEIFQKVPQIYNLFVEVVPSHLAIQGQHPAPDYFQKVPPITFSLLLLNNWKLPDKNTVKTPSLLVMTPLQDFKVQTIHKAMTKRTTTMIQMRNFKVISLHRMILVLHISFTKQNITISQTNLLTLFIKYTCVVISFWRALQSLLGFFCCWR